MICLIRSDLRRAVRSKAVWIFAALSALFIAYNLFEFFSGASLRNSYEWLHPFLNFGLVFMSALTVHLFLRGNISDNMLVPRLTAGNSRMKIYFAAFLSAAACSVFLWALFEVPFLVLRTVIAPQEPMGSFALGALAGGCSVIAVCAFCTALEMNLSSRAATLTAGFALTALYLAATSIPGAENRLFGAILRLFPPIYTAVVDVSGNIVGYTPLVGAPWEYALAALLFAAAATVLGLLFFRKRDLR